jgi:hypothetical protein
MGNLSVEDLINLKKLVVEEITIKNQNNKNMRNSKQVTTLLLKQNIFGRRHI